MGLSKVSVHGESGGQGSGCGVGARTGSGASIGA